MMTCAKCGESAQLLITNVQTSAKECWQCVAGPDQMCLRRVQVRTSDGCYEDRLVHAVNNLVALDDVISMPSGKRRRVIEFQVTPLAN